MQRGVCRSKHVGMVMQSHGKGLAKGMRCARLRVLSRRCGRVCPSAERTGEVRLIVEFTRVHARVLLLELYFIL